MERPKKRQRVEPEDWKVGNATPVQQPTAGMRSKRDVQGPLDMRFFLLPRQKQIELLVDDLMVKKRNSEDVAPLKTLLGEARLMHNQECVLYHGKESCVAQGCQWSTNGWFRSGQCIGPHLDKLQLSEPPRISDIVRLDKIMKEIMATNPEDRTEEEDDQLFYLSAVKQYMIDHTNDLQEMMQKRAKHIELIKKIEPCFCLQTHTGGLKFSPSPQNQISPPPG